MELATPTKFDLVTSKDSKFPPTFDPLNETYHEMESAACTNWSGKNTVFCPVNCHHDVAIAGTDPIVCDS